MTWNQIVLAGASVFTSLGMGGVIVALIRWRQYGPKTKAQTAQIVAEAQETEDQSRTTLIGQVKDLIDQVGKQGQKIIQLENMITEQGDQIAKLQRHNRDLRATMQAAVIELLAWIKRARAVMTVDQKSAVGEPPDYQHLITPPERS